MDTSKEWTIFWCVVIITMGVVFYNLTNKMTSNTHFALEQGYTRQTLQGEDMAEWVKI